MTKEVPTERFSHGEAVAELVDGAVVRLMIHRAVTVYSLSEVQAYDVRHVLGQALDAITQRHELKLASLRGAPAASTPEPPPVHNDHPSCWDLVMADLERGLVEPPGDGQIHYEPSRGKVLYRMAVQNLYRLKAFALRREDGEALVGQVEIYQALVTDMRARDQFGRQKYGTPLQPHNGRNALNDAYQEALDLVVYLRQDLYERGDR